MTLRANSIALISCSILFRGCRMLLASETNQALGKSPARNQRQLHTRSRLKGTLSQASKIPPRFSLGTFLLALNNPTRRSFFVGDRSYNRNAQPALRQQSNLADALQRVGMIQGDRNHGECELVRKETLCSTRGEPVRRFTFRLPPGSKMNVNTALRQVVVVRALGQMRLYSPTSEPNREDGTFDLVVRVYRNGLVSQWLDSLPLGGSVPMTWPWPAPLRSDRRNPGRRVGLIAFGIGITELYRTAVQELQDPNVDEVVLLYATKVMEEQKVLDSELQELLAIEPVRFRIERTLTQEQTSGARFGRVNRQMLSEVFPWDEESRDTIRFVAAGTATMIDNVHAMLEGLGYDRGMYSLIRDNTLPAMLR